MAVLLFLSTIISPRKKYGYIDDFMLQIVDDLYACETFPWGRYTFDESITNISRLMDSFKGRVKSTWCFPGFLTPLEILACECIPDLKSKFRVDVVGAEPGCPRMCKQKWRYSHMKGFPIEDVNDALGSTTEIHSILEPELSEVPLMARITENEEIQSSDPITESWEHRLCVERKKICWKELYNLDVSARGENGREEQQQEEGEAAGEEENIPPQTSRFVNNLKALEKKVMGAMKAGFTEINKKISVLDRRLKDVELCLNDAMNKDGLNFMASDNFRGSGYENDEEAAIGGESRDVEMSGEDEAAAVGGEERDVEMVKTRSQKRKRVGEPSKYLKSPYTRQKKKGQQLKAK
ncbi:PREDICTED: uncharacterized protein At3g43530-like [Camelina sativa]|uniref:Uncharacterized protein At3g43530-like n=1 Tax=Camelina sativa TaxID=90675 RepID=A0ABM1R308_CAMSA|nr:PREDICTED: uncharacterized protein At3g43530-like [Camelina sativa]